MEIAKPRPPYVTFELRPVEDRDASLKSGCHVSKDVAYAIITPAGSKERTEKIAEDWIQQLRQHTKEGRFPEEWLSHYVNMYAAWKQGNEIPVNGTPLRLWPAISPAQLKTLLGLNFMTVEDLAAANEEGISRLGMGGRALKQRAVEWLAAAQNIGKSAERAADLGQQLERALTENQKLQEQLAAAQRQVQLLRAAGSNLHAGPGAGHHQDDDEFNLDVQPTANMRKL